MFFADEIRFEGAGRVVPFETLSVPVPQFQTVLLFAVLVAKVVGFARIPVGETDGSTCSHPKELPFFRLVGSAGPEVLAEQSLVFYEFLQLCVFVLAFDADQVKIVIPAELVGFIPVGLEEYSQVILFVPECHEWHRPANGNLQRGTGRSFGTVVATCSTFWQRTRRCRRRFRPPAAAHHRQHESRRTP